MADHQSTGADLHGRFVDESGVPPTQDITGAPLTVGNHDTKEVAIDNKQTNSSATSLDKPEDGLDGDLPNEHQRATLRRMGDALPASTWLVAIVELSERFTYYGCQGLFQNYIQKPYKGRLGQGALGLGQQGATGLNTFFQFWCYVTPILGAIVADQYLGRYKAIIVFTGVYIVGLFILVMTSLPISLQNGAGTGGFITAILIIGIGTGGIKSNVAPLIADQYQRRHMALETLPTGERIIRDPGITMQRIYMIFYWCINVGALSLLATPYMEQDVGFYSAFLMCFLIFLCGTSVLIWARKKYVVRPPQGSIITDAFRALGQMIVGRNQDAPKPSYQAAHGRTPTTKWDDHFIDEIKRALIACRIFVFYPVFWVCYGQFSSNFVSQAEQMEGHGIPNDLMQNFDPIAIIVTIPILDRLVYPFLRRFGIKLRPITRITMGFFIAGLGIAYAAIVQHLVYSKGPCFDNPLDCDAANIIPPGSPPDFVPESKPNRIHIAVQTPAYILIGVSEIFISVTGLEYAYTKAPPNMKSFVQSMYLLTNAFGSAISEALVPVAVNPKILWMYTGVACSSGVTAVVFWFLFHHLNAQEESLNELDKDEPMLKRGSLSGGFVGQEEAGERARQESRGEKM